MSPLKLFRTLILGELGVFLFMVAAGISFEDDPTASAGFSSPDPMWVNILSLVLVIVWIAALVGLWRLRPWSRRAYLGVMISLLGLQLVGSPETISPSDAFLIGAMWFNSGLLVAFMYFSPVAGTFEARSPAAELPTAPDERDV